MSEFFLRVLPQGFSENPLDLDFWTGIKMAIDHHEYQKHKYQSVWNSILIRLAQPIETPWGNVLQAGTAQTMQYCKHALMYICGYAYVHAFAQKVWMDGDHNIDVPP